LEGIPTDLQRLFFNSRKLADGHTLAKNNIQMQADYIYIFNPYNVMHNNHLLYSVPIQHFTNSIENYYSMMKSRLH
jgi:hypothetical protein